MPTYDYRCENCHEVTEAFQKMSDAPLTTCPHCGKEGLHRIVTGGAGVLYKGEGWYVTDYSKKSSGGKDTPPTTTASANSTKSDGAKTPAANTATVETGAKPSTGGSAESVPTKASVSKPEN